MAQLTKIEKDLLEEIDKNPYLEDKEIPYTKGKLEITHKQGCTDPVALFRPSVVICYGGKFRGKEFVAIGDSDEGFITIEKAAVSRMHSVVVGKVQKWTRRDRWLIKILPPGMVLEVAKDVIYCRYWKGQKSN